MAKTAQSTWSVRSRIVFTIITVAALGFAIVGSVSFLVQRQVAISQLNEKLRLTVDQIEHIAELGTPDGKEFSTVDDLIRSAMQRIVIDHNSSMVGLIDGSAKFAPAMEVLFRIEDHPEFIDRVITELNNLQNREVVIGTAGMDNRTLRYLAVPIYAPNDPKQGVIITAYDLTAELSSIGQASTIYFWSALGTLLILAVVSSTIAGRLLKPIRTLQQTATRIHAADLSERIPVVGNDDVSQLTVTVNEMLERISDGVENQKQLVADVRHELRTPITIMRGHLELLDPNDPEDIAELRSVMIEELDRMGNLVTDITTLAETRQKAFLEPSWVDFAPFFDRLSNKSLMLSDQHSWNFDNRVSGLVWLDPERSTQATLQLLENAVKYAPLGEQIQLSAEVVPDLNNPDVEYLRISVYDSGPAISAADQNKIFERFTRSDNTEGITGSGLGLSIVNQIAQAHGGLAKLVTGTSQGNTFSLFLPYYRVAAQD